VSVNSLRWRSQRQLMIPAASGDLANIGAYLGLVPRRYQSGEVDYTGSISKCGDRRVRTLLYEAANVMLTRYKGSLKLKDWAIAIAKRSTMRKARIALARRLAIIMHAMLRHGTEFNLA
jgi:transposase